MLWLKKKVFVYSAIPFGIKAKINKKKKKGRIILFVFFLLLLFDKGG